MRGFATVLSAIVLQAPLDSARGELPSDTRTLMSLGNTPRRSNIATFIEISPCRTLVS